MSAGSPDTRADAATQAKVKVCAECGKTFTCSESQPGCWCAQENICAETLAALRARFVDCVCPACLSRAEARTRPLAKGLPGDGESD
ncbi:MAG: cysteine-rich CWC family protein [Candidatus Acidiferrales bacterium]